MLCAFSAAPHHRQTFHKLHDFHGSANIICTERDREHVVAESVVTELDICRSLIIALINLTTEKRIIIVCSYLFLIVINSIELSIFKFIVDFVCVCVCFSLLISNNISFVSHDLLVFAL